MDGCAGSQRADQVSRSSPRSRPGTRRHVLVRKGPRPGPIGRVPLPPAIARTARPRDPRARRFTSPTLTASSRDSSPPSRSPHRMRAIPCMSAGAGVTKLPAANLRTASSASARICSTPRWHSRARSRAAHASAEGSPGRAGSPRDRSSSATRLSGSRDRATARLHEEIRLIPASRALPGIPATTRAGLWARRRRSRHAGRSSALRVSRSPWPRWRTTAAPSSYFYFFARMATCGSVRSISAAWQAWRSCITP